MQTVTNLVTDEQLTFDERHGAEYCLAYAHYLELDREAWFLDNVTSHKTDWKDNLTFHYGEISVGLGDWVTLKDKK